MYNVVPRMGRMTLNPNATEFVPSSLKLSPTTAETSGNNPNGSSRALNRTDSANSGASDDEFRQYWRNQLPDDIIPDFGMMSVSSDDRSSWEHSYAEENMTSAYFSEDRVEMASTVVETEAATDPLQLLAHEFPGFAVESLADILRANGGDLSLTIDMLIQLEIQDDAMPVRQSPSQAQIPSLTPLDFPALSGSEFPESRYGSEEGINGQQQQQQRLSRVAQHTIGVEDFFTSMPYRSGSGGFRGPATDFAGAVRKNINVNEASQWQNDRNGRVEPLSSSSDDFGMKIGTFSSSRSSAPVWLETGEAVSSMYEELREEARDHARVRNAYFEQARQAYLSGNKALAKELSTKGQHHNGLMKEAHNRAGEAIFQQRNGIASSSSSSGNHQMLDLHGLHVNEAIPLLKRQLALLRVAARASQQRQQVLICVGTGHHTKGSRTPARLPLAVEKFLVEDERLPFTEQQPGLLRVVVS